MKHKFKVTLDGVEREIEVDIDPKALGLFTKEDVDQKFMPKDAFEPELDRRVKSSLKGMVKLEDVAKDADLRKKVYEALGVQVTSDGKPQVTVDQLQQLQEKWKAEILAPEIDRRTKAEQRVGGLLRRSLVADILAAAGEARVHDHLRVPVREGTEPPIVSILEPVFGHSEEHDTFFVKKGDAFEFSSDAAKTGKPYMQPREFVLQWATKKENEGFIDAKKPGGAHLQKPGSSGGTVTLEAPPDGVMTLQQYQDAQKTAGEAGRVVVTQPTV